jgi:hypothetical protein
MDIWRHGVEREIPVNLEAGIIENIQSAWEATGAELQRHHLTEIALEDAESRLRGIELFEERAGIFLLDAWSVSHGGPDLQLCLLVRPFKTPEQKGGIIETVTKYECHMAGLFSLRRDLGRVLMRPETFGDKLLEIFRPREVDFDECPQFSDRYYVLASDEERLRQHIPPSALDHLGTRRDLLIEISGTDMVVLWPQAIGRSSSQEACRFFIELVERLASSTGPYR